MSASAFFRLLQMAAATIALATGTTAAVQAADSAVILQYHRFGEAQLPTTSVTIDQLKAHIEHLVRGDYVVLPVPEIVATLRARRPLPDRTIGITIDDAARTVIEEAWPRFEKAGFPFTVFVSTDAVDEGHASIMNWDELRRLVAAGVTIGNHGSAHARMWRHDDATNNEDILKASRRIKDELGVEPVMFAFPYGEWNRALRTLVSTLGFSVAFGQQSGAVHADADFLTLPRFPLNENYGDIDRFKLIVDTLVLGVDDATPVEPILTDNPPAVGFTLRQPASELGALTCYASDGVDASVERLGTQRVEVRFDRPFPPGRVRLNCTAQNRAGGWHWLGMQFVAP